MITIDEAEIILDEIAEGLPKEIYKELNGGIILLPDVKFSPHAKHQDLYIMGEYVRSASMGRMIKIYFGSFEKAYRNLSKEEMRKRLRDTLLHEFTHHLESLAGERGLELWDEEQLKKYLGG